MSKKNSAQSVSVETVATIPSEPGNALATQPKIVRDKFFVAQRAAMGPAHRKFLDDLMSFSQDGSVVVSKLAFGRHREANRPIPADGKPRKVLSDKSIVDGVASVWSTIVNQCLAKLQAKLPSATTAEILARHNRKSDYRLFVDGRSESDDDGSNLAEEAAALGVDAEEFASMMKMLGKL